MGKIPENMATKGANPKPQVLAEIVVDDSEPESELEEPGSEVAELAPLQEEVSSRFTEVEELHNEILIDLLLESTMEIVPSLIDMSPHFS